MTTSVTVTGRNPAAEVDGPVARVTLQTVADRVGVSRMTVSNAFSRPDQLSPALRERILAAAEELGYVGPDPTARALARGSTGAVGVLLTDSIQEAFLDEVATRFLGSVAAGLEPTGLALTLITASDGASVPARELPLDGAVVYSCRPQSPSLDWLIRRKLPLVYVDQAPQPGHPSVNIDDRGGARAAARHLLELGHRRIACLTANLHGPHGVLTDPASLHDAYVATERLEGWLEELHSAGADSSIMVEPYRPGVEYADRLLDVDDRPTAVLCFSDAIALTVIEAARRRGLDVPGDLSVVGYDDAPMAARVTPGLTTVAQDVDRKGREAAAALVAEMAGRRLGRPPAAPHVVLPTSLVVRESTAPPRADLHDGR
jgi:DNA-binding LacI/PurR family transcriptional regulator